MADEHATGRRIDPARFFKHERDGEVVESIAFKKDSEILIDEPERSAVCIVLNLDNHFHVLLKNARRPFLVRPAGTLKGEKGELESEEETQGRLCQVGELVEIEPVDIEVGDLVHKAAIFRAHTKVARDVEVGSAAVNEGSARLSFGAAHDKLLSRIENQCSTAAERVRAEVAHVNREMHDQRASHFVKIRLQR